MTDFDEMARGYVCNCVFTDGPTHDRECNGRTRSLAAVLRGETSEATARGRAAGIAECVAALRGRAGECFIWAKRIALCDAADAFERLASQSTIVATDGTEGVAK